MQITINGKPETLPDRISVEELLRQLNLGGHPCAVEVNKQLIPKRQHPQKHLDNGDAVEVVTLVGGG